jgi:hypothetical protein
MATEYSVDVCKKLEKFREQGLHRPMRVGRYDAGDELIYDVSGLEDAKTGRVRIVVEKFVGGGFAGQVYRVKILQIEGGPIEGLDVGGIYALKILIPPSRLSQLFRNALYGIGFQGPFQPQVNPAAAVAGVLWQKFIRRSAKIRFGDEQAVVDVYATLADESIGSCGQLSQWVDGRTWQLEVDDRLDLLKRWYRGRAVDAGGLGSPEYRAKKQFMADFIKLLHDIGAYEFARQYEWSTCKSQPNCLKRRDTEDDPAGGLTAVDFTAGLALLPVLPMSPGDFKLIWQGIRRGSLVQFDRGSIEKLDAFVQEHKNNFSDMDQMLSELKAAEQVYRDSLPDVTHNCMRLLYSRQLWSTMLDSAVTGWKMRNIIGQKCEQRLRSNRILTLLFFAIGLIPFLGTPFRRIWGRADWRRHYAAILTSWSYFCRAVRGRVTEKVIVWHRAGRISGERAIKLAEKPWRYFCHLPFLLLIFPGLHRFFTDRAFRREKLVYIFVRPFKLYFNAELREQWLREMVTQGQKKHMLSDEDAGVILSQVNEPFIQKYLKCLAVHICTLPVTQIVSVTIAVIYWLGHWGQPNAFAIGLGIIGFFQVTPISPGSLVRGLYVLYLVIRERNFRDYNIAVFLGFFKYIGYLAFPIQMTYHYPALARFMASHWATEAVHFVPVFGERGALLEHWVFCLFYNWPLTIRRRMRKRAQIRAAMQPRYWHIVLYAAVMAGAFGLVDFAYLKNIGELPRLRDIWPLVTLLPLVCGAAVTLGCAGAGLGRRIAAAAGGGAAAAGFYTAASATLGADITTGQVITGLVWRIFVFAVLSIIGAIITELKLPDPDLRQK